MKRIKLGQITAPVGIKGEVRVFPYTDEITRFSDIDSLEMGEDHRRVTIEKVRYDKGMAILKFREIPDRNAAETLRNLYLYLPKDELWEMPEDTYLLDDLIGMSVETEDGKHVGTLAEVIQNSSQDVYRIEKEDASSFLLPAVKEFIIKVDPDTSVMTVHLIDGITDL